jgi:hypothetical protein
MGSEKIICSVGNLSIILDGNNFKAMITNDDGSILAETWLDVGSLVLLASCLTVTADEILRENLRKSLYGNATSK